MTFAALRKCVIGVLAALFVLAATSRSLAQQDVNEAPRAGHNAPATRALPPLPRAPSGFTHRTGGGFTWEYPRSAESSIAPLIERAPDAWAEMSAELGVDTKPTGIIRIGVDPEQMAALAPIGYPPPAYATGVTYSSFGLILMTLSAPATWERPDLLGVFEHELSHLLLFHVLAEATPAEGKPQRVPRWFAEGLAIHQSGERSIERAKTLWEGTVQGEVKSLRSLDRDFHEHSYNVSLAYAQSADIVSFLLQEPRGERKFRILIRKLREGASFEQALLDSFYYPLDELDKQWHASLAGRYQTWPLVIGGSGLGAVAFVLVLIGAFRNKKRRAKRFARWEEEEQSVAAIEAALIRRQQEQAHAMRVAYERLQSEEAAARAAISNTTSTEQSAAENPPEPQPPSGEAIPPPEDTPSRVSIPKVHHEGRIHTLH